MVNLWMGVEGRIDYTRGQRNCWGCDGKVQCGGSSLASQWLRLCTPSAGR